MPNLIELFRRFFLRRLVKPKEETKTEIRKVPRIERPIKQIKKRRATPKQKIRSSKVRLKVSVKRRMKPPSVQGNVLEKIKPITKPFTIPQINMKRIFKLIKFPKLTLPKMKIPKKSKIKSLGLPKIPSKIGKTVSTRKPRIPREHITEAISADVMEKTVYSVQPKDTLSYVVRLFADKKISGAPVVKNNNLVGIIGESDIVKFIGSKELLSGRGSGLKNLGEITVEGVMHKNPVYVYEYTKLSDVADLMNKYDITRLPVLNERRELVGIVARSDIMRSISKNLLFKLLEKHEVEKVMSVETDIDEILQIVERKGSIGLGEIKKRLMLPEEKIEEWGKILERHNLIELFYPPIGKLEFRKKIK